MAETLEPTTESKSPRRRPTHQSQWAAQFAVASELCKQGHEVALTLGNHPTADLMVYSPGGVAFVIDVKGLAKRNFWLVREKPDRSDVFYVFAFVPAHAANRYFILTQSEVNAGIQADLARARQAAIAKGRPLGKIAEFPGVAFGYAEQYEDRWEKLPA